jgi:hypothetical protein
VWLRAVWKHVRTGGMHLSSLTKAKRSLYQPKAGIDHVSDWTAGFDPLRTFGVGDGSSSRCSEAEVRLTLDDAKTRHRSFDHLVGGPRSDDAPSLSSCPRGEAIVCERGGHASEPCPGSSEGFIGDATTYTIQFCCSDATFQASALVWVGCAVVNPGGVNLATTACQPTRTRAVESIRRDAHHCAPPGSFHQYQGAILRRLPRLPQVERRRSRSAMIAPPSYRG